MKHNTIQFVGTNSNNDNTNSQKSDSKKVKTVSFGKTTIYEIQNDSPSPSIYESDNDDMINSKNTKLKSILKNKKKRKIKQEKQQVKKNQNVGFHAKPNINTINICSDSDPEKTESEDDDNHNNNNRNNKLIKTESERTKGKIRSKTGPRKSRKRKLSETMDVEEDYYKIDDLNIKVKRRKKSKHNKINE